MAANKDRGELMAREITQQPERVEELATSIAPTVQEVVRWSRPQVSRVIYVGRGTSGNAAVYGQYLTGILAGLHASVAVPGLSTIYGTRPRFDGCLVVAISQSGETDDVVAYLRRAREDGALTVAVTNDGSSPLADAAHRVLPTGAGREQAIPATKTYTTQLAVLLLYWATWADRHDLTGAVRHEVPAAMHQSLIVAEQLGDIAQRYANVPWMVTAARGVAHANAREAALKILESSYVPALSFSVGDLWHGPVAAAQEAPLTVLLDYTGPASASTAELAAHLASSDRAVLAIAPPGQVLDAATHPVPIASDLPELASPLVTILPAQEFARTLGLARGVDPDEPRGLSKVTHTR